MFNCSGCWDNPCTCTKSYEDWPDEIINKQIEMLQGIIKNRHPPAALHLPFQERYPEGMTVKQLKGIVNITPEKDINGNDFIVMIRNNNDDELPGDQAILTETLRQTPDGKLGTQLVLSY